MALPGIMVSSTFYDLKQIREDLRIFIANDLGYNAILSEHSSFPVDPNVDTVTNCRDRVKKDADILILVIGGRYGSIDLKSKKSITNLEYEEARKKGLPIYVFVEKNILANMLFWTNNKDGDFSGIVDTPLLFEFVDQIRTKQKVWTFPFETAQDVIDVMRQQLAHLFLETFGVYQKVMGAGTPQWHEGLSAAAIKIVLDKPEYWEFSLLFQVWEDEIAKRNILLREYESGLKIRHPEQVPVDNAIDWLLTRTHHLQGLTESATELMNVALNQAMGEEGVEADEEYLVWVALYMGRVYEQALEWTLQVRCARVEKPFTRLVEELAKFPQSMISKFQTFPEYCTKSIEKAISEQGQEENTVLELTFVLELSNQGPFDEAMARAQAVFEDEYE